MAGWNGIFYNGIWTHGFDFLPDGVITPGGVWDFYSAGFSNGVGSAYARFTGKGCQISGNAHYCGKNYQVNLPTHITGFALKTTGLPGGADINGICTWSDSVSGQHATLGYNTNGQLGFYRVGGFPSYGVTSQIGALSATGVIVANAYNYIETLVTISATVGVLQLAVNGTVVLTFNGNTKTATNPYVNQLLFGGNDTLGGGVAGHNFDDFYILDMTGASPLNTFLGPGRIQTDGPTQDSATGGLNQWAFTTPQGTDYGNLANIPASLTQYDSDGTVNDRMSFRFPAITSRVFAMNMWYSAAEDSAGTRTLVPIFRNNGVDQVGPLPVTLTSGYVNYNQVSTIDPNTGLPWANGLQGAANTVECGLKVNS